jgi:hypothetical protein
MPWPCVVLKVLGFSSKELEYIQKDVVGEYADGQPVYTASVSSGRGCGAEGRTQNPFSTRILLVD